MTFYMFLFAETKLADGEFSNVILDFI